MDETAMFGSRGKKQRYDEEGLIDKTVKRGLRIEIENAEADAEESCTQETLLRE